LICKKAVANVFMLLLPVSKIGKNCSLPKTLYDFYCQILRKKNLVFDKKTEFLRLRYFNHPYWILWIFGIFSICLATG